MNNSLTTANTMATVTALIPIKVHSERVPEKNIRDFMGKPLYHHIIETLEKLSSVARIIINTDSDHIARTAPEIFTKVHIHIRPDSLRGDFVPTNAIFAYDIANTTAEHFLQTHCTNPLVSAQTLDKAIRQYFRLLPNVDSLYSVTEHRARFYNTAGEAINHDPRELLRTQDLPPLYEENSNFYLFSRTSFKNAGNNRIGLNPGRFVMNRLEAVDIDEAADWKLAEALWLNRGKEE